MGYHSYENLFAIHFFCHEKKICFPWKYFFISADVKCQQEHTSFKWTDSVFLKYIEGVVHKWRHIYLYNIHKGLVIGTSTVTWSPLLDYYPY